jgi:ribosomal protein L24E
VYEPPRGLTLVSKEGNVKYLCSAKCRKNMAMKRKKVRWVNKFVRSKKDRKEEAKAEIAESKE